MQEQFTKHDRLPLNIFLKLNRAYVYPPNVKKILDMCNEIGDYYETGKDSIGHGRNDHIASVITRATMMVDTINTAPENSNREALDMAIAKASAALHDIGNLVSRDGHNHFAYGIITGHLTPSDILSVPNKDFAGEWMTQSTIDYLKDAAQEGVNFSNFHRLYSEEERNGLLQIALLQTTFGVAYDGIEPENVKDYIAEKFHITKESEICSRIADKIVTGTEDALDFKDAALKKAHASEEGMLGLSKRLKEITEKIQNAFYPDQQYELQIVAKVTQDHNIDWKTPEKYKDKEYFQDLNNRYQARSLFGMIIADADKSNDPVSEIIRSYKFSMEKFVKEGNPEYCKMVDNRGTLHPALTKKNGHYFVKISDVFGYVMNDAPYIETEVKKLHNDIYAYADPRTGRLCLLKAATRKGEYIPDIDAVAKSAKAQVQLRYNSTDGKDSYMQLDQIPGLNISERIFGKIHEIADDPKKLEQIYKTAIADLEEAADDSGKAVQYSENTFYGYDENDIDSYEWAVWYFPDSSTIPVVEKQVEQERDFVLNEKSNDWLPAEDNREVQKYLRFTAPPTLDEIQSRAEKITDILEQNHINSVILDVPPFMVTSVIDSLERRHIIPLIPLQKTMVKVKAEDKATEGIKLPQKAYVPSYLVTENMEIVKRAAALTAIAKESGAECVMLTNSHAYPPVLTYLVEKELREEGITPVYSLSNTNFSHRIAPGGVEMLTEDNIHRGFIVMAYDKQENVPIANLTPVRCTKAQKDNGVFDLTKSQRKQIEAMYRFSEKAVEKVKEEIGR